MPAVDPSVVDEVIGLRTAVTEQSELLVLLARSVAAAVGPAAVTDPAVTIEVVDLVQATDAPPSADPLLVFGATAGQFAHHADRAVAALDGQAA